MISLEAGREVPDFLDHGKFSRACLKKAFCKMCVTICGRFCLDEGAVAGYGNRIQAKSPAKLGRADCGNDFSNTF